MSPASSLDALKAEALAWITAWRPSDVDEGALGGRFSGLAARLHQSQRAAIPPFDAYCAAREHATERASRPALPLQTHQDPQAAATDPRLLPCVPVAAFKRAQLYVGAEVEAARFETSGTSDGQPGVIALPDTTLYDASLRAGFHAFVVPDAPRRMAPAPGAGPFRVISLVPDETLRPYSSLGHMVQVVADTWGLGPATWLWRGSATSPGDAAQGGAPSRAEDTAAQLDLAPLWDAADAGAPVLILATSIALAMLREQWPADLRLALPPGSRLMDTGGPKGRHLHVSRDDQHAWLSHHLGLHPALIVGELGMTELASQRYETTARAHLVGDLPAARAYVAPPWLQSVVLSPGDLRPLPAGETGLVAHLDLANVHTCGFILTADRGRLVAVGARWGLVLEGRVPGAEWRGCGLDVEGLLGLAG